jgi:hypothetical protein
MRRFNEIDPLTVSQDPRVVASIQDDRNANITYYFLIDNDHLIIATADYFTNKRTGESKWLHYQIEFPKRGLLWFLDTLQHRFFKTEAEGGLPKGKFHDKTEIEDERIKLGRAFNADGNRGGGYSFVTLDRKEDDLAKEHTFTDELLFKGGLIKILQDIAGQIQAGQL